MRRHEVPHGFVVTLKSVTLNDPGMPFCVKTCFLRRFD